MLVLGSPRSATPTHIIHHFYHLYLYHTLCKKTIICRNRKYIHYINFFTADLFHIIYTKKQLKLNFNCFNFYYYSAVVSVFVSSTTVSTTSGTTSVTSSTTSASPGTTSSLIIISLFSILAPTFSLVLAALPILSLK